MNKLPGKGFTARARSKFWSGATPMERIQGKKAKGPVLRPSSNRLRKIW